MSPLGLTSAHKIETICIPLQITFKGNGVLGGMQIIADAHGNVKGKLGNPAADPPLRSDGKLDVGAAVGRGKSI